MNAKSRSGEKSSSVKKPSSVKKRILVKITCSKKSQNPAKKQKKKKSTIGPVPSMDGKDPLYFRISGSDMSVLDGWIEIDESFTE